MSIYPKFISKKTTLRPVAFCSSCPPDVPGAYNVNSSCGYLRPGLFCPGATFLRPDASGAVRRTLPSNHTPGAKPVPPAVPDAPRLPCCLPRHLAIANSPLPLAPGSIPWYSTPSELRPHSPSQSTCHPERSHTPPPFSRIQRTFSHSCYFSPPTLHILLRPPDPLCVSSLLRRTFSPSFFSPPHPFHPLDVLLSAGRSTLLHLTFYLPPPDTFPTFWAYSCPLDHSLILAQYVFMHLTHLSCLRPPAYNRQLPTGLYTHTTSIRSFGIYRLLRFHMHTWSHTSDKTVLSILRCSFDIGWRARGFSRHCINYSTPFVCNTAGRFCFIRRRFNPELPPQCLLIIWISGGPLDLLSLLLRDSGFQCG